MSNAIINPEVEPKLISLDRRYTKSFAAFQVTAENIQEASDMFWGRFVEDEEKFWFGKSGPCVILDYPRHAPRRIARIGDYIVVEDGIAQVYTEKAFELIFQEAEVEKPHGGVVFSMPMLDPKKFKVWLPNGEHTTMEAHCSYCCSQIIKRELNVDVGGKQIEEI